MLTRALDVTELWQGEMKSVVVQGKDVLLVNVDGEVHAFQDRCRHLAVQLSKGTFADGVITCWAHDWQYDARTGRGINPSNVSLRQYSVTLRDGAIWVDVDG